jgi:hypothetical protein
MARRAGSSGVPLISPAVGAFRVETQGERTSAPLDVNGLVALAILNHRGALDMLLPQDN